MVYIKPSTRLRTDYSQIANWHAEQAMQFTLPKMGKRI